MMGSSQTALSRAKRLDARLAAKAALVTRQAGIAYLYADADNNGSLTYEEFRECFARLQPAEDMFTEEALRGVFNDMDFEYAPEPNSPPIVSLCCV